MYFDPLDLDLLGLKKDTAVAKPAPARVAAHCRTAGKTAGDDGTGARLHHLPQDRHHLPRPVFRRYNRPLPHPRQPSQNPKRLHPQQLPRRRQHQASLQRRPQLLYRIRRRNRP